MIVQIVNGERKIVATANDDADKTPFDIVPVRSVFQTTPPSLRNLYISTINNGRPMADEFYSVYVYVGNSRLFPKINIKTTTLLDMEFEGLPVNTNVTVVIVGNTLVEE